MNLLYTTAMGYEESQAQSNVAQWRAMHHLVEYMPAFRLKNYLQFDPSSTLALIDAIVCSADSLPMTMGKDGSFQTNYAFDHAMMMSWDVRALPDACTMRDGRKWRSAPFIICHSPFDHERVGWARAETHAHFIPSMHRYAPFLLMMIEQIVQAHHQLLLKDYEKCGIMVRFDHGRAQIQPALRRKRGLADTDHYHAAGDRRKSRGWVTFSRNKEGLNSDVELFEELLSKNVSETEMHKFFSQHPSILTEARGGIPISHGLNFEDPKNWKPDFAFSPILGPVDSEIELLELKGPAEEIVTRRFHPGFTRKVHGAIDQVRDYQEAMKNPANFAAIKKALGFLPESSRLAVLIGRNPDNDAGKQTLERRKNRVDVEIITYDDIFATQVSQL